MGRIYVAEQSTPSGIAGYGTYWAANFAPCKGFFTNDSSQSGQLVYPYEEGTWTPQLVDDSLSDSEGQTYSDRSGYYIKVGNAVYVWGYHVLTSYTGLTTSNQAKIAGLPFPCSLGGAGGEFSYVSGVILYDSGTSLTLEVIGGGSTHMKIWEWTGNNDGVTPFLVSYCTDTHTLEYGAQYYT